MTFAIGIGLTATEINPHAFTYGYDRLYRLTSAAGGPAGATTYTYDPVGNRATRTRASTSTPTRRVRPLGSVVPASPT